MPRHFDHWFRGASVEAASRSSTSTPWRFRGASTMPVIRGGSGQADTMTGGLGAGGSCVLGLSARGEARARATLGGQASGSTKIDVIAAATLELVAAANLSASMEHEASGGCSASGDPGLSVAVNVTGAGGVELAASAGLRLTLEPTSSISWSVEGRPLISSGVAECFSGGVSALIGAAAAQGVDCVGSGGLSTSGTAPSGVAPSVAAPPGRSFKYWRRGGVAGEVGPRRGDFAHRYRGWSGVASSGRPGGASLVRPAGAGAQFGGSAVVGVDHHAGSVAVRGWVPGGTAGAAASSVPIVYGGLAFGGDARSPDLGIVYRIYCNDGRGGAVDYESPIAEVSGLEWTSQALPAGSSFRFAVRAYDPVSGLKDENLDATAALVINTGGLDATRVPRPPVGLRAIDRGGGRVRLEWAVTDSSAPGRPTHFHVFLAEGAVTDFSSPILVPASAMRGPAASTELQGLLERRLYAAIVRAANSHGDDGNINSIRFTADHTPPACVDGLSATLPPTA